MFSGFTVMPFKIDKCDGLVFRLFAALQPANFLKRATKPRDTNELIKERFCHARNVTIYCVVISPLPKLHTAARNYSPVQLEHGGDGNDFAFPGEPLGPFDPLACHRHPPPSKP